MYTRKYFNFKIITEYFSKFQYVYFLFLSLVIHLKCSFYTDLFFASIV